MRPSRPCATLRYCYDQVSDTRARKSRKHRQCLTVEAGRLLQEDVEAPRAGVRVLVAALERPHEALLAAVLVRVDKVRGWRSCDRRGAAHDGVAAAAAGHAAEDDRPAELLLLERDQQWVGVDCGRADLAHHSVPGRQRPPLDGVGDLVGDVLVADRGAEAGRCLAHGQPSNLLSVAVAAIPCDGLFAAARLVVHAVLLLDEEGGLVGRDAVAGLAQLRRVPAVVRRNVREEPRGRGEGLAELHRRGLVRDAFVRQPGLVLDVAERALAEDHGQPANSLDAVHVLADLLDVVVDTLAVAVVLMGGSVGVELGGHARLFQHDLETVLVHGLLARLDEMGIVRRLCAAAFLSFFERRRKGSGCTYGRAS